VDREVNIIVSNARAEAEKIVAEGEAEYMRLLAESYSGVEREEFYSFMRGLDALKTSLTGNANKTVILDKDSLLARILVSP
jgi:membrane protease subunit HflC